MPTATAPLSSAAIIAELGYTPGNDATISAHIANSSNPHSVTKSQVGLGSVENTALSTWVGSASITTLGTISAGTWNAAPIGDAYISSAATWNAKQAALGFTPENVANKATNFSTVNDALYPTVAAAKAYADSLVVGLLDDRGNYDASGNAFPSSGGSGSAGAILKGDLWLISVAGTLGGTAVAIGDQVRALTDTPGQTASNWAVSEANIGYVSENAANKATSFSTLNNTLYPTTQAVANYAQPLNGDLSAIAALTPSNDDILQRKSGAWANRTIAQLKTDLSLSGTNTGDQTSVTGNAGTATALQTARAINGTNFDGTAAITVTAAAGTLTGTTLNATVVTSSLTSVGTIVSGVWNGTDIALANIAASSAASKLLGRGDSGAGDFQEITIGSGLTMTGTTLSASGSGTTINASDGVIPYRSSSSAFSDSPLSVSAGRLVNTPSTVSSGVAKYFQVITPADTALTASTEAIGIQFGGNSSAATVVRQHATGALATQREYLFVAPTYSFAGASTLTLAATVAIDAAPIAGTNATITNAYALHVAAGRARFDGGVTSPGGAQSEKFGNLSTATGSFAVTVGNTGANGSDNAILVGALSTVNAACDGAIVIGSQSGVTGSTGGAIVIGKTAGTGTGGTVGANSISIGIGSIAKTANTMVVGGSSQPINVFYAGKGESHATPVVWAASGTHGLGTDIAGADIAIQSGFGTGTGINGAIIFYGADPAGSTASTRNAAVERARISTTGVLTFPFTYTAGGTTGAQTINKVSGSVNFGIGATSLVVTNNKVTANSIIIPIVQGNDTTMKSCSYTVTSGSFTLFPDAAPTAETKVTFVVLNL